MTHDGYYWLQCGGKHKEPPLINQAGQCLVCLMEQVSEELVTVKSHLSEVMLYADYVYHHIGLEPKKHLKEVLRTHCVYPSWRFSR